MRGAAGQDEHGEGAKDPAELHVPAFRNKVSQCEGDGEIGERDDRVGCPGEAVRSGDRVDEVVGERLAGVVDDDDRQAGVIVAVMAAADDELAGVRPGMTTATGVVASAALLP